MGRIKFPKIERKECGVEYEETDILYKYLCPQDMLDKKMITLKATKTEEKDTIMNKYDDLRKYGDNAIVACIDKFNESDFTDPLQLSATIIDIFGLLNDFRFKLNTCITHLSTLDAEYHISK